jgi:signal transduction histidine kinase
VPPSRQKTCTRFKRTLTTTVQGLGIGLAAVARIAAHGDRVGAEDSPGGGTAIW